MDKLTSSRTGTLYFAYGSNLSPEQMSVRCRASSSSSIPMAIARLDNWKWIVCKRGYANIVELPPSPAPVDPPQPEVDSPTVWGVLYNMTGADEATLDRYEGHSEWRNPDPVPNPDQRTVREKPFVQGHWDYNKQYIPVTVTRWLVPDPHVRLGIPESSCGLESPPITVLAYVDEKRTIEGEINYNYIGRMNRAIRQGIALGIPQTWINTVLRRWVIAGIEVENGYVGKSDGYVPDDGTETNGAVEDDWRLKGE